MRVAGGDWLRLGCVGVVAAEVVIEAPDQHAPLWVQVALPVKFGNDRAITQPNPTFGIFWETMEEVSQCSLI